MTTKEKQIEAIQEIIKEEYRKYTTIHFGWFAEALYDAGYRKTSIREFAEKLKEKAYFVLNGIICEKVISIDVLDELLKEYEENDQI